MPCPEVPDGDSDSAALIGYLKIAVRCVVLAAWEAFFCVVLAAESD